MPVKYFNPNCQANVNSNIGVLTVVDTSRKNRPKDLPKPYDYILSIKEVEHLYKELKTKEKELKTKNVCMALVTKKPLSKGMKVGFWCSAYGDHVSEKGISPKNWEETCEWLQKTLLSYLGPDAQAYFQNVSNRRFQMRFETYIAYREIVNP